MNTDFQYTAKSQLRSTSFHSSKMSFASKVFTFPLVLLIVHGTIHWSHAQVNEASPIESFFEQSVFEENSYHGKQMLNAKHFLEWNVDISAKTVTFSYFVNTTGWVGLGFSKNGLMKKADLVVGGVGADGKPYLTDMFSDHKRAIRADATQDWTLVSSGEESGITYLKISRALDTCDPYDYSITEDLLHILWASGESDEYAYHFHNRGSFRVYLLNPVVTSPEQDQSIWRLSRQTTLPTRRTSYICSIHKSPSLTEKHHMIGFYPFLENELAVTHAHHFIVWRCVASPGLSARDIFESLLDFPGEECYFNANRLIPIQLCKIAVYVWAVGGLPLILQPSTGFPFGESVDEYFMLEIHYDSPEALPGITFEAGVDIHYTSSLREQDGTMLIVGYDVYGLMVIPPITLSYELYGHCSTDCMDEIVPESGLEMSAILFHTHLSGRKVMLKHFRDGKELSWVAKDDNYDATFQQYQHLGKPIALQRGDQLTLRCEYDNTWTNESVVSGFETSNEMCIGFIVVNRVVPYFSCFSQVPANDLLHLIGVKDFMWDIETQERLVTAPPSLAGKSLIEVANEIDWTSSLRYKLQKKQITSEQIGSCPTNAVPANAVPTNAVPANAVPTNAVPANAVPTNAVPANDVPTNAVPATTQQLSVNANERFFVEAFGFGVNQLMGRIAIPRVTPGPHSSTNYPEGIETYTADRRCPRYRSQGFPFKYTKTYK